MTAARTLQPVPDQPEDAPAADRAWARTARYDVDAEKAVLGAMMLNPLVVGNVEDRLTAESFYRPIHGLIYTAIVDLATAGKPTDPVAVAAKLADAGKLGIVGGAPYLHSILNATPLAANAGHYAGIVAGLHRLRIVDQVLTQGAQLAATAGHDQADDVVATLLDALVGTDRGTRDNGPKPWRELVNPLLEEIEARGNQTPESSEHAVPTGWHDMDRLLGGGGKPGQLIVVAGRPGTGKSVSAMGWAQHAAMVCKIPTAVFALEMSAVELGMRWASADTRIPFHAINAGRLDDQDWAKIGRWAGETADAPLYVDDTPTMTVADIRARARRLVQRHGVRMVVIDYLGLISPGRAENRQVAVATMTRALKLLAKELAITIVLVAQLNRGPEQRADKRPEVSDLRDSGAIEQDADVIILTHLFTGDDNPRAGEVDLIVGKHRNGPTDTITLAAQLHLMKYVSLAVLG